ncbi:MAG: serine/threonine protein kinase [Pirellulaceae bacterium]|nr:serine/threonine protein kinase [Pirellulaceae bacterium]
MELNLLGNYRLIRLLRSGQTTQVWEAIRDHDNGRFVIKTLHNEYLKDSLHINYLKQEYMVGHELDHKNIIKIHEYSVDKGRPFLVMEIFKSPNMKVAIRENHQDIMAHIQPILQQCADSLIHLHSKNWLHCDVKPDNFLLNIKHEVRLIDFSISQKKKTGVGKLLASIIKPQLQGTRSYLSPEQILRKPIDEKSDIYGFGCTVFEMLTAKLPFTGINENDLLTKHLKAAPPLINTLNTNIRPEFADFVAKMLAKSPADRPHNMQACKSAFQKIRIFRTSVKSPEVAPSTED